MANAIEKQGIAILKKRLLKMKRKVEESDNKTFDLRIDNKYAEVKTKSKSFSELDFVSFTDKQFKQIQETDFLIFLVTGVGSGREKIREFRSKALRNLKSKPYTSHEYNKSVIQSLRCDLIS